MRTRHGFTLMKECDIRELNTHVRIFTHAGTGAQLLSLENDDENKVFGIAFRTPAADSTGVAHILEHSVLCGSRKYPVKEPFVELLKGSLQTFLNAFTYPDKTCYPVASQNTEDFYNLMDVYLDAVFYPRLTPFVFQQEGWHYELEAPDRPLTYKGVVFNEMKGAYSSPDNVLSEYSLQSLFPDTPYGIDSGGDPKVIPTLTFERFKAFHDTLYHPSNARIYLYGDDDPDERLRRLHEYLGAFDPLHIDSAVPLQPTFSEPRRLVRPFMVGADRETDAKGMITINWVLPETVHVHTNFSLRMLEYMLLGMPASPLRKALIDSGLGEDLAGDGLGSDLRNQYFSTGLKGIHTEDADKVETLVLDTLRTIAGDGFDRRTVDAALNTIEFRLRENNAGSFPRGLLLMLRSLTTWLHDGDPLALLAFEGPLEHIRTQSASDESYFEDLLTRHFLENPHRTTLVLTPDPALREREISEETARLASARAGMSDREIRDLVQNTETLTRLQQTPDSAEALATIPALKMSDLDRTNKTIPVSTMDRDHAEVLFHDLFTSGIAYLDMGFDLHSLPGELLPYVPLFGRALVEMGTDREDYVSLTQRISGATGGLSPQSFTSSVHGSKTSAAWLFLRGKAMVPRSRELTGILADVLGRVRLDNRERFRQMVLEEKAGVEEALIPSGHQMVSVRLRSHFSEASWASEQMGGISYLFFLRELARAVDERWPEVLDSLEAVREGLISRTGALVNVTVDDAHRPELEDRVNELLESLPAGRSTRQTWTARHTDLFEGLTVPSQINYVGKGADLYALGYRFNGSALVITRYLRNSWLWDRVRVQGGAYGAFCLFDRLSGTLAFVSYRDPNLMGTLDAFDRSVEFLRDIRMGPDELTKSITGAVGDLDSYMLPDAKGFASMVRRMVGDTDEVRQRLRDEVLATTEDDFKAFAETLRQVRDTGVVKVLGSSTAIEQALEARPGWLHVVKVL